MNHTRLVFSVSKVSVNQSFWVKIEIRFKKVFIIEKDLTSPVFPLFRPFLPWFLKSEECFKKSSKSQFPVLYASNCYVRVFWQKIRCLKRELLYLRAEIYSNKKLPSRLSPNTTVILVRTYWNLWKLLLLTLLLNWSNILSDNEWGSLWLKRTHSFVENVKKRKSQKYFQL